MAKKQQPLKIVGLKKEKNIRDAKFNIDVNASYWKLGMITINDEQKEINFSINLYIDEESEEFIESYSVTDLMGAEDKSLFEKYFSNNIEVDIRTACYKYILDNVDFFKNAEQINK